ncbi:hypothetical protein ACJIZ3_013883 [Penstemon smallii]|uniref:Uncharacterized protein n=1 Tax=Penstemon smallii TaxID=265156 RepID=A0ABD3RHZ9_9LAMI
MALYICIVKLTEEKTEKSCWFFFISDKRRRYMSKVFI